jgi:hypothetical protein
MHNCSIELQNKMAPFDVFICYKKSSGKDFADHLKSGLEELGLHSFIDSKDIPKIVDGKDEWIKVRDRALKECKTFILLITPGFDLSEEVKNELKLARDMGNKDFIYFRHRDLGRQIVVDLSSEKVDLGRQEQVSFETKEELLRLAHNILFKGRCPKSSSSNIPLENSIAKQTINEKGSSSRIELKQKCEMCSKQIEGEPLVELLGGKPHNFDSKECAQTFKKLKSLYGENFE